MNRSLQLKYGAGKYPTGTRMLTNFIRVSQAHPGIVSTGDCLRSGSVTNEILGWTEAIARMKDFIGEEERCLPNVLRGTHLSTTRGESSCRRRP